VKFFQHEINGKGVFILAARVLRSLDKRRQIQIFFLRDLRRKTVYRCAFHGAGVAGYYSRCPSGKSKTKRFISASFLVKFTSKPTWIPNIILNVCVCLVVRG
jgi:hypothetical protein